MRRWERLDHKEESGPPVGTECLFLAWEIGFLVVKQFFYNYLDRCFKSSMSNVHEINWQDFPNTSSDSKSDSKELWFSSQSLGSEHLPGPISGPPGVGHGGVGGFLPSSQTLVLPLSLLTFCSLI